MGSEESLLVSSTSGHKCPPLYPYVTTEASALEERGSVAGEDQSPLALSLVSHHPPAHIAPPLPITFHFPPCGSLELSQGSKAALSFWMLKPETLELSTLYPTHSQAVSPVSPTFKTCGRLSYFSPSMGLVLALPCLV